MQSIYVNKNKPQLNETASTYPHNPYMLFVSYMRRSAKFLILNKKGIFEKISYDRRAYESVDEKSLS